MIKASNTPGAKYLISDMKFWRDIKGIVPMGDCLAVKPTRQDGIHMFMECNKVIPITFESEKIVQNNDGLYLVDGQSLSRIYNIKEIGLRTVAVSYITNS